MGDGDGEVFFADADHIGELFDLAKNVDGRSAAWKPDHLDAVPLDQAAPERLGHGFFRRPTPGVVALGKAELLAVGDLRFGK